MKPPFHLAIGVGCLKKAREFYSGLMGAKECRSDSLWVDFNFFGHQLTCHLIKKADSSAHFNSVDGHSIPIPHFGVIVPLEQFQILKSQIGKSKNSVLLLNPISDLKTVPASSTPCFLKTLSVIPSKSKAIQANRNIDCTILVRKPLSFFLKIFHRTGLTSF